jgi:hypothetical protein
MKIALISANCGNWDIEKEWVSQVIPADDELFIYRLNDTNWPMRIRAMTPKMQSTIPKFFGWQMFPDMDVYVWVDASRIITRDDFITWIIGKLGDADMALCRHQYRTSIEQETAYVRHHVNIKNEYLFKRYSHEWIDEQFLVIKSDPLFKDNILYASTFFAYHPIESVQQATMEWWHHFTRYHILDQLALPYVLWKHNVKVNVIEGIETIPHIQRFGRSTLKIKGV